RSGIQPPFVLHRFMSKAFVFTVRFKLFNVFKFACRAGHHRAAASSSLSEKNLSIFRWFDKIALDGLGWCPLYTPHQRRRRRCWRARGFDLTGLLSWARFQSDTQVILGRV